MEAIAFYVFGVLITGLFLITILSSNVLYAMSSLAAGMVLVSGLYFVLGADFLGAVQLVVYSGAVMALYAFGMMFFDTITDVKEDIANPRLSFLLTGMIALIVVVMAMAPVIGGNITAYYPVHEAYGNAQDVGLVLFTKYLIPFEVAAVMLLVAMIGGIILAGKKMDYRPETEQDHTYNMKKDEKWV